MSKGQVVLGAAEIAALAAAVGRTSVFNEAAEAMVRHCQGSQG